MKIKYYIFSASMILFSQNLSAEELTLDKWAVAVYEIRRLNVEGVRERLNYLMAEQRSARLGEAQIAPTEGRIRLQHSRDVQERMSEDLASKGLTHKDLQTFMRAHWADVRALYADPDSEFMKKMAALDQEHDQLSQQIDALIEGAAQ